MFFGALDLRHKMLGMRRKLSSCQKLESLPKSQNLPENPSGQILQSLDRRGVNVDERIIPGLPQINQLLTLHGCHPEHSEGSAVVLRYSRVAG
jgi:hypothetical protein